MLVAEAHPLREPPVLLTPSQLRGPLTLLLITYFVLSTPLLRIALSLLMCALAMPPKHSMPCMKATSQAPEKPNHPSVSHPQRPYHAWHKADAFSPLFP